MCISRNVFFIFTHKYNIVIFCIFINQAAFNKLFHQVQRKFSFFCQILYDSCIGFTARRKSEFASLHRFRSHFCSIFSNQHLHCLWECLFKEFHYKVNRIAAFTLAVPEPFISPYSQAVMLFPSVFVSTLYQLFSLRTEKLF